MHQAWACRLPGTAVPWANLYRCNIYTGSTVYTTPVLCSVVLVTSSVADQATNTVASVQLGTLGTYPRFLTEYIIVVGTKFLVPGPNLRYQIFGTKYKVPNQRNVWYRI
jgi:hypothetical protein